MTKHSIFAILVMCVLANSSGAQKSKIIDPRYPGRGPTAKSLSADKIDIPASVKPEMKKCIESAVKENKDPRVCSSSKGPVAVCEETELSEAECDALILEDLDKELDEFLSGLMPEAKLQGFCMVKAHHMKRVSSGDACAKVVTHCLTYESLCSSPPASEFCGAESVPFNHDACIEKFLLIAKPIS